MASVQCRDNLQSSPPHSAHLKPRGTNGAPTMTGVCAVPGSVSEPAVGPNDTAIVYDPQEQRLYQVKGSHFSGTSPIPPTSPFLSPKRNLWLRYTADPHPTALGDPFTPIKLSRWSNTVDIYVKIGKTETEAFVGRVNLSRLGWPVTKMRLRGKIDTLYVLGKVRDGQSADPPPTPMGADTANPQRPAPRPAP